MFNLQKIGNRLYFAFALLILLEFATVYVGFRQFQSIQALSTDVAQDRWPKTVIANKIIDNINSNAKSVLALMFPTKRTPTLFDEQYHRCYNSINIKFSLPDFKESSP